MQGLVDEIAPQVFTAGDLGAYALECGWTGPPASMDPRARRARRVHIEAWMFSAYGLQDQLRAVMDSFPLIAKKEVDAFGDFRLALEIQDVLSG
jgi:hypothetical protein